MAIEGLGWVMWAPRFLLSLLVVWVLPVSAGERDLDQAIWEPAKEERGVEVFTADIPGSKFLAFKATTVIAAPVGDVLAVLTEHPEYPGWYDNCAEVELIEYQQPDTAFIRVVVKTPFPWADREAVNRVTVVEAEQQTRVVLASVPNHIPSTQGLVRMQMAKGSWLLTPSPEGTKIVHTYHGDPMIRVPAWLVNRFVVDGPISTLVNLRKRVEG